MVSQMRLNRLETGLLRVLNAPAWEDSQANTITVWRTRICVVGTLSSYAIYLGGNTIYPGAGWQFFSFLIAPVFIFCAIFDMVDGAAARKEHKDNDGKIKNGSTKIGAFLD